MFHKNFLTLEKICESEGVPDLKYQSNESYDLYVRKNLQVKQLKPIQLG